MLPRGEVGFEVLVTHRDRKERGALAACTPSKEVAPGRCRTDESMKLVLLERRLGTGLRGQCRCKELVGKCPMAQKPREAAVTRPHSTSLSQPVNAFIFRVHKQEDTARTSPRQRN